MDIILYLLTIIQEQHQQICWLILFICRYIPLKQWAHDEIHSPAYQKFTTNKLPVIKQDCQLWIEYYQLCDGKAVSPCIAGFLFLLPFCPPNCLFHPFCKTGIIPFAPALAGDLIGQNHAVRSIRIDMHFEHPSGFRIR